MGCRRKTRPGRLAALDQLLLTLERPLLQEQAGAWAGAPVVDLGLGARPWTTLEWAAVLRPLGVDVVGVDHAQELVERARADHATDGVRYEVGGFDLPVGGVRLVRAMNVLRDFSPDEVVPAHERMGRSLLDGGLLVEGSCGPEGEVGCAHLVRRVRGEMVREGVLMWLDGARGTAPLLFRDRLPRDLRAPSSTHPLRATLLEWMSRYRATPAGGGRLAAAAVGVEGIEMLPAPPGVLAAVWRPDPRVS